MDLHLHTPASSDYQEDDVTYLSIIQQGERRGLNILAFTDHNTVRGYREMLDEIERLNWLESLGRMTPEEEYRLSEYRRLMDRMLILPGFEFTATFGFHVLGLFPPETEVRQIEHLLLDLRVPPESLDSGETNVGATTDVLTAYAAIREAGGLVIAAHANSNNGVAMRGFPLGGQTRIAYTQDPNLHCLEVTDLERRGSRTTRRFFDGSKPEYPRPMRCIQGSDAHRLVRDPNNGKNLGVGERVTEVLLPELSFDALYDVLSSNDFTLTRPYRGSTAPYDHILAARQEGPSIVQAFHESAAKRGGHLYSVISDVCAFANTNGGTIYVGVPADKRKKPVGLKNINQSLKQIEEEVERRITPPIEAALDILNTEGTQVIRVQVPRGDDPPYAIDGNKIYVRDDEETSSAVRDEIVQLVVRGLGQNGHGANHDAIVEEQPEAYEETPSHRDEDRSAQPAPPEPEDEDQLLAPRTGVEIIATEKRKNTLYHHVRDLRNGNIVRTVPRQSARKLWHYAILEVEDNPVDPDQLEWHDDIALVKSYHVAGRKRYDLAMRHKGRLRVFYGVTDDGIQDGVHDVWRDLLGLEHEE
ncbi:MAG: RNA-binding domain-containing protein [Anaerolineae bacterium]